MKKTNKKIPKTHLPKYEGGGLGMVGKDLKNTGLFLADMGLAEWAPNAITQDQYSDTKYGANLGKIDSMNESFSSQSPIRKNVSKYWTDGTDSGMNEEQQKAFNQVQPIAKVGSSIGEMWTTKGLGSIGQGSTDAAGNFQPSKANGFAKSLGDLSQAGTKEYTPNMYSSQDPNYSKNLNKQRIPGMYQPTNNQFPNGGMNMKPNAIPQYPNGGKKEPIITNNPKDPKLRAYNDSLNLYNASKNMIPHLKNSKDYNEWLDYTNKWYQSNDKKVGQSFKNLNKLNGEYPKPIDNYSRAFQPGQTGDAMMWKKPVQPYKYQEEEPIYENQFTDQIRSTFKEIPKQEINQNRSWNFNNPNYKTLEYKDNTGKVINTEYYDFNNKPIQQYSNGGIQYSNGGTGQINAEVEKEENSLSPNGEFTQFNGNSHSQGGIKTDLPGNSMIFSDRLKLGKKTFAELNKVNNTSKEDKILESNKFSSTSKRTAELMKFAKNKNSQELFNAQEALKQAKVEAYAKKMGVTLPQPNIQTPQAEFAMGGRKLPKYWDGGESEDNPLGYKPTNKVDQMRMQQALWNSQNKPSSSSWLTPEMMQASSDALIEEGYTNPNSPVINTTPTANTYPIRRDKNGKLIFDTPTSSTSSVGTKRDQELYDAELARMNASGGRDSNKFDWKNTLGQVGNFAAQNAGNIYNLSRYNKPEIEKYERMKATFLDPSAALRDAEAQTRRAEYNVRGASGGNAGTYLSNRVALNAQNTINKARIHTDYQNANAGIANSVGQYNNELARQEVIANAENRARNRSGKGEAISQIGKNYNQQVLDTKKGKMDDSIMQMLPKLVNDPSFMKFYEEYKKNNPND